MTLKRMKNITGNSSPILTEEVLRPSLLHIFLPAITQSLLNQSILRVSQIFLVIPQSKLFDPRFNFKTKMKQGVLVHNVELTR